MACLQGPHRLDASGWDCQAVEILREAIERGGVSAYRVQALLMLLEHVLLQIPRLLQVHPVTIPIAPIGLWVERRRRPERNSLRSGRCDPLLSSSARCERALVPLP
eukprot:CAMPEP_0180459492 /NCGR_PEP_ID=MMETSP1036_2-20121128/22883_1 /TAXON_ID=632150 /ORGANISM="Azadinium spinosum, Strain 3D9" /LENGTH=105 /DNA_ID=CAMNT_0022466167 /DNA_START=190 /DNA_END=504 /DNA_ORIENTATION=+